MTERILNVLVIGGLLLILMALSFGAGELRGLATCKKMHKENVEHRVERFIHCANTLEDVFPEAKGNFEVYPNLEDAHEPPSKKGLVE
jgi:hypothetical protein